MCRIDSDPAKVHHGISQCPFTIRRINDTTHLVRECDEYGEYPHIYVKKCTQIDANGKTASVLVINDTGVGTDVSCRISERLVWNIKTFIDANLNPDDDIPYWVILSHCHYDHVLGLKYFLSSETGSNAQVQIVSSAHDRSFTTPYKNLQEHSICKDIGLLAPDYRTTTWAENEAPLIYNHPSGGAMKLPIITLCTPGHTPDSLSWFDTEERTIYVGDSFYGQQSRDTCSAPWGIEALMPILFTKESDLYDWWKSLGRLIGFIKQKDRGVEQPVKLAASHVTADANAAEFLLHVQGFMTKVLRDELTFEDRPVQRGDAFGVWSDPHDDTFSLGAPLRVVDEGRHRILHQQRGAKLDAVITNSSDIQINLSMEAIV
ncbi:hypothetical protein NX059_001274 [Plenodomus lindquistii]|nr:hypothetical protein NX059_001274 [Plenodomus lindquistii]